MNPISSSEEWLLDLVVLGDAGKLGDLALVNQIIQISWTANLGIGFNPTLDILNSSAWVK